MIVFPPSSITNIERPEIIQQISEELVDSLHQIQKNASSVLATANSSSSKSPLLLKKNAAISKLDQA
jgi:hypothetical protein